MEVDFISPLWESWWSDLLVDIKKPLWYIRDLIDKKGVITLPQRKTSLKELRKSHAKKLHNLDIKTDLRKTIKNFLSAVTAKNKTEVQSALKTVVKKLDKATKRNVLHKNTASRRKSRFMRLAATIK
jgi:small subunit ribosomal protein S20